MKFKIHIENQTYDVQVDDINARPVVVIVDGERVEVWPEADAILRTRSAATAAEKAAVEAPHTPEQPAGTTPAAGRPGPTAGLSGSNGVRAPIPGVITRIAVQPGEMVTHGQELCVLEAMKMNNSIRASRNGQIAAVHVSIGQHVKHSDVLMEYA